MSDHLIGSDASADEIRRRSEHPRDYRRAVSGFDEAIAFAEVFPEGAQEDAREEAQEDAHEGADLLNACRTCCDRHASDPERIALRYSKPGEPLREITFATLARRAASSNGSSCATRRSPRRPGRPRTDPGQTRDIAQEAGHGRGPHRRRERRQDPDGGLPGGVESPLRPGSRRRRDPRRGRPRRARDPGRLRSDGLRPARRPRSGPGAAGGARGGALRRHALRDPQQGLRLRHEGGDARARHDRRRLGRGGRGGRHGVDVERALPPRQGPVGPAPRPRPRPRPHVPRRPGGRLRPRPPHGQLRGGYGPALPVHARSPGRLRARIPRPPPDAPPRRAPSTTRSSRSRRGSPRTRDRARPGRRRSRP